MASPVEQYLAALRRELRHDPLLLRRVTEEVRDHLAELTARELAAGASQTQAEEAAVRQFGDAHDFAREFDRFVLPIRILFWGASITTVLVAFWLISVIVVILPRHDPTHIPLWTGVTAGYLLFSALSMVYLFVGPRPLVLRITVIALSIAALVFSAVAAGQTLLAMASGRDFEGYLLLMGVLLSAHALLALAYTWISAAIARKVAVG